MFGDCSSKKFHRMEALLLRGQPQDQFLITTFVAQILPTPNLSTLVFSAQQRKTGTLTEESSDPIQCPVSRDVNDIFHNITTFEFHVFLSGYLRHLDTSNVRDFDGIEIAAPILYPKVRLVHHARSGQSKFLICARG